MAKKDWLQTGADGLTFGERLDDLRYGRGITQSQLAAETGIAQSRISGYINEKKNGAAPQGPDCATIIAFAKYFGVSTDYLLGLTPVKTPFSHTQAIIQQTGLSEENTLLLQVVQSKELKEHLTFLNDLISISMNSEMLIHYIMMKSTLNTPTRTCSGDMNDVIDEWADADRMRSKGLVQLTGEEAFHYYCSRIATDLENALLQKYVATAEWGKQDGID